MRVLQIACTEEMMKTTRYLREGLGTHASSSVRFRFLRLLLTISGSPFSSACPLASGMCTVSAIGEAAVVDTDLAASSASAADDSIRASRSYAASRLFIVFRLLGCFRRYVGEWDLEVRGGLREVADDCRMRFENFLRWGVMRGSNHC